MEEQKDNKALNHALSPSSNASHSEREARVKVKINPKRAITGYGKAGEVVEMPEALAQHYARIGYVVILK